MKIMTRCAISIWFRIA